MTCKDCIHYDLCRSCSRIQLGWHGNSVHYVENIEEICKDFKDRSRFVELPCKVGDMVYVLKGDHIEFAHVIAIYLDNSGGMFDLKIFKEIAINFYISKYNTFENIGKTVFLTREEAEQALKLKERENDAE